MSLMFNMTYGTIYNGSDKIGPPEYWFRYEDVRYSVMNDDYGDSFSVHTKVELRKYPVIKHTATGAWIKGPTGKRFVKRECRKRFAAPTLALAKESFVARKKKQAAIYRARADNAERAIRMINGDLW